MKKLILLLLFVPLLLIAQKDINVRDTTLNTQTDIWMTKISSDPELRIKMMDMMLNKTTGNKEEMSKLAKCMMDNPEMHRVIIAVQLEKSENFSSKPRGLMQDSVKGKKEYNMKQVVK